MNNNFFYQTKFDFKKFLSYMPLKKNIILDYGCGNGIFSNNFLKHKKIKIIYMIDKNIKLKKHIKNKYHFNNKIRWTNSINGKYDVVLMNSVSQYLDKKEYDNLIKKFFALKIKTIIISDIPKYPRIIEAFILLITNPKDLFKGLSYLKEKDYLKMIFYYKKHTDLILKNKKYIFKFVKNLSSSNFSRYTLIIDRNE